MMVDVSRLKHKPSDMGWRVGDQVGVATTTRLNANDAEVYVSNVYVCNLKILKIFILTIPSVPGAIQRSTPLFPSWRTW